MKLFKCTIVTYPNACYVKTLLIVAEDAREAEEKIKETRRDKYNPNPEIVYTHPLTEIKIDMTCRNILEVGFGHGDNDNAFDD